MFQQTNLRIALQKSGRLADESLALLRKCGIRFGNGAGKLRSKAENFPLEIFFLRDDDIPEYVADGVADIGIVGLNVLEEKRAVVERVAPLGFGRCRLAIAVQKSIGFEQIDELRGKRIATSYPAILESYLESLQIDAEIHTISGSVEIAPSIGLADAVCDLVSSGSTLFSNGLREVATVLESEATLISRLGLNDDKRRLLERMVFRIRAVREARRNKYILLNAPDERLAEIIALIPGMKSPTVMPLAESGWSSVHSVIDENDFWDIVERLRDEGAEGILVLSIDQMIK